MKETYKEIKTIAKTTGLEVNIPWMQFDLMNREEGFRLSKSWKPLICSLKKPPPGYDARSRKLQGHD
jgi:hypothetical protein